MIEYLSEVKGKNGIIARVVAKSVASNNPESIIVTWEVEHHRWILAEINKHRMFSNNYQSSRAVPVDKIVEQVKSNPATPVFWGKNQAGMQAKEECSAQLAIWDVDYTEYLCKEDAWYHAACLATDAAEAFNEAGYHKQIVNRLLEPFMMVKGVITATEIDNFFHLRCHPDAQPELQELANCMWEAYIQAKATVLYSEDWHTPYYQKGYWKYNGTHTFDLEGLDDYRHTLPQALKISAAACAQVSFRKLDLSWDTVNRVYSRLIDSEQPHSVCMEHQAKPIKEPYNEQWFEKHPWEKGVSHVDIKGNFWSGNFKGWIQNRKLLDNETCNYFKGRDKLNNAE